MLATVEGAPRRGGGAAAKGRRMRRAAVAVLATALAGNAAAGLIDQQQPSIDAGAASFRVGGPTRQELAQTVTAGIGGRLVEVRLPVGCATGDLLLQIQEVSGSVPGGRVLATESVSGSRLPATAGLPVFRSLPLAAAPVLNGGTRYAVVLRATGTCEVAAGPVGDPYGGGDGLFRDREAAAGDWLTLGPRADLPFQTVVETSGLPDLTEEDREAFVRVNCFVQILSR